MKKFLGVLAMLPIILIMGFFLTCTPDGCTIIRPLVLIGAGTILLGLGKLFVWGLEQLI